MFSPGFAVTAIESKHYAVAPSRCSTEQKTGIREKSLMDRAGSRQVQLSRWTPATRGTSLMTSNAAMRVAGYFARPDDATDADLLQRFVAERDGEAFAALVGRHGPMVFGVCRRVLGDWHLAEDAFQAAFVVLARKAAAVSPPGAVAGWLHGVALRVAKDARRSALRRFNRERPTDMPPEQSTQTTPDDAEFQGVLDDELQLLPGKYRQLLVACDLEGRPRQPVAESLRHPGRTLSSRLTTARKMLANRLAKRGIALPSS